MFEEARASQDAGQQIMLRSAKAVAFLAGECRGRGPVRPGQALVLGMERGISPLS
jgi:hypothetical protein